MGLTTREVGSSSFNDMISSIDRRSEFVENRAGANVTTNNALISYGLSNSCSILNAPCGYSNGVYPSLTPIQTFGSELVTNGGFDTDSDWTKLNATISNGKGNLDGDGQTSLLYQNILTQNKFYKVTFTVSDYNEIGTALIINNNGISYYAITTNGTFTINFTHTISNGNFLFRATNGAIFSIDNVSVKEVTEADFDFTRGSSATRVNEKGLVQDVQLLSGELVQNGDFEQIGSEQVVNGSFDTDTGWTKGTGWSIANGSLNGVNATSSTYQNNGLVSGKFYKVVYDVSNYSSGTVQLKLGGTLGEARNENGTYTEYIKASQVITWIVGTNFTGSIDNVSVKEVGQNWTFFGEAEFTENGARIYSSSGSNSYIGQTILTNTKKYKLSYEIVDSTQGRLKLINVNGVSDYSIPSTLGTHSIDFIANNPSFFILRDSGITDVTIDNISVIEITDDTDLPRINYKDGEGSLLLEPQSTNLITYSEDFSQSDWSKTNISITTNSSISPDGTINASLLTENSSNAQHFIGDALTLTSGISYSVSVYAKKKERSVLQISPSSSHIASSYANYDLDLGVVSATGGSVTAEIEYLSNDWYRCILKFTVTSTATATLAFFMQTSTTALRGASYQGDGTSGLYLWGAQVEALSYATSYIPTEGSTKTRLQDVCNNSGSSDLINSTEGVLYAEISALANDGTNRYISLSDGSVSNRVNIFFDSNNNLRGFYNGLSGSITINTDITLNNKIAFKYKSGDSSFWFNGFEVATRTDSLSLSGLDSVSFDLGGGSDFYGNVKCVAVFKEALSDTELQKLTTI